MDFIAKNHGTNLIILPPIVGITTVIKPIELHWKENGSITDEPAFLTVSTDGSNNRYIGQISLKMFNEGLAEIGYALVKI